MPEISRRRFFGLLGGVVATAVAPPIYVLAPAGGWRPPARWTHFVGVDYGLNESFSSHVMYLNSKGIWIYGEGRVRYLNNIPPESLAEYARNLYASSKPS